MANQEHLEKLREGVEAWNQWREENPVLQPDLQGADLNFTQLRGAYLNEAQLQGAFLLRTQLQRAHLNGAFFDNATSLNNVILGDEKYGVASLADVSWGSVNLAVVDWSPLKMLGDEYQARQSPSSIEEYHTAVRANRQLAVALRDQGLNEDADRFAYRAQVLQRKVFWMQKKFGRWFFSRFLALLAGYGYRMERILFTYAIAVLLFAVVYFVLGMFYEPHLSFLDAVLTSVTAFHGRVFAEPFLHSGEPQLPVTAFEAIVGLVVEGVFIAMLTKRFFGT